MKKLEYPILLTPLLYLLSIVLLNNLLLILIASSINLLRVLIIIPNLISSSLTLSFSLRRYIVINTISSQLVLAIYY